MPLYRVYTEEGTDTAQGQVRSVKPTKSTTSKKRDDANITKSTTSKTAKDVKVAKCNTPKESVGGKDSKCFVSKQVAVRDAQKLSLQVELEQLKYSGYV